MLTIPTEQAVYLMTSQPLVTLEDRDSTVDRLIEDEGTEQGDQDG